MPTQFEILEILTKDIIEIANLLYTTTNYIAD